MNQALDAKAAAAFLRANPAARLLDVRTDREFATARISGAVLVNSPGSLAEILTWPRDTPLVIYCHHGFRSLDAAARLREEGFRDVRNLSGGIDAWSREVDPAVPRY